MTATDLQHGVVLLKKACASARGYGGIASLSVNSRDSSRRADLRGGKPEMSHVRTCTRRKPSHTRTCTRRRVRTGTLTLIVTGSLRQRLCSTAVPHPVINIDELEADLRRLGKEAAARGAGHHGGASHPMALKCRLCGQHYIPGRSSGDGICGLHSQRIIVAECSFSKAARRAVNTLSRPAGKKRDRNEQFRPLTK